MRLRVLDFGLVPALRTQAIYHGVAHLLARDGFVEELDIATAIMAAAVAEA
jgi:hypothetical protein